MSTWIGNGAGAGSWSRSDSEVGGGAGIFLAHPCIFLDDPWIFLGLSLPSAESSACEGAGRMVGLDAHGMAVHAGSQPRAADPPRNQGLHLPVGIPPWEWGPVDPRCSTASWSPLLPAPASQPCCCCWGWLWRAGRGWHGDGTSHGVIPESLPAGKGWERPPLLEEFLSFIQNLAPALL